MKKYIPWLYWFFVTHSHHSSSIHKQRWHILWQKNVFSCLFKKWNEDHHIHRVLCHMAHMYTFYRMVYRWCHQLIFVENITETKYNDTTGEISSVLFYSILSSSPTVSYQSFTNTHTYMYIYTLNPITVKFKFQSNTIHSLLAIPSLLIHSLSRYKKGNNRLL